MVLLFEFINMVCGQRQLALDHPDGGSIGSLSALPEAGPTLTGSIGEQTPSEVLFEALVSAFRVSVMQTYKCRSIPHYHTHTNRYTDDHTHTHASTHKTHTRARARACTHACAHTHMHTHTHTHPHNSPPTFTSIDHSLATMSVCFPPLLSLRPHAYDMSRGMPVCMSSLFTAAISRCRFPLRHCPRTEHVSYGAPI